MIIILILYSGIKMFKFHDFFYNIQTAIVRRYNSALVVNYPINTMASKYYCTL